MGGPLFPSLPTAARKKLTSFDSLQPFARRHFEARVAAVRLGGQLLAVVRET